MNALSAGFVLGGLLAMLALASGCADTGEAQGAPGATMGAGSTAAATSTSEIPWECGATFSCVFYSPEDSLDDSSIPYGSHVEPGACALQTSWEDEPSHRLSKGGRGELYGVEAHWERSASALVLCADALDGSYCYVCTPDPKTLPKTASSPAAACSGTPADCSSRFGDQCWHGCTPSYGNAYTASDDDCDGTSDSCESLGTEDLCTSIPGCAWR